MPAASPALSRWATSRVTSSGCIALASSLMPGLLRGELCASRILLGGTAGGMLSGSMNMTVQRCWMRGGHCLIIRFVLNLDDRAVAAGHSVDPARWRGMFDDLMLG